MGDDNKETQGKVTPARQSVYDFAQGERDRSFGGVTDLEKEFTPQSQSFWNAYSSAAGRQRQDYDTMMSGYGDWSQGANNLSSSIASRRPDAITYNRSGDMSKAMGGYSNFADTGGYSNQDVQDLRARGMAPIRAAYGNTMQEMDRARSLGGPGGASNYIAASSKAQRELPGQLSDATTNVNAGLASEIRQGKLAGMAGLQQGSLAEASLDQRAKELTEQGLSAWEARQMASRDLSLKGLEGQKSLYGTTPGMASTFGNQALQAYQQRNQLQQMRQQFGLGLIDQQLQSLGQQAPPGKPWWQTGLEVGGGIGEAALMSSRELKENITPLNEDEVISALKDLPLYKWNYIGDSVAHMGPIAEELHEKLGIGDGKTVNLIDIVGLALIVMKKAVAHA